MYKFVFTTNVAFGAALALCLSLLFQPVAFAYAEESTPPPTEIVQIPSGNQTLDAVDDKPDSSDQGALPVDDQELFDTVSDNGDDEEDLIKEQLAVQELDSDVEALELVPVLSEIELPATGTSSSEVVPDITPSLDAQDDSATTSTSTDVATETSATTSDTVVIETNVETDSESNNSASSNQASTSNATTSAEAVADRDDTASTTPLEIEQSEIASTTSSEPVAVSSVQTDNVFAFNKNECTEVEDGSFYCQKISYDTLAENDLFAAPDSTGDMEIYVVQNGEQIKITDNAVDDASPYYDARSKTIVWHRLINDRYQIISYDIQTGEEVQITDTAVNNMEPTRNGGYTVWQRWVQNNWEIILLDGDVQTQITDSIEHDIAPHIRGDLIIWNVRSSDGTQSLMTYDIGSDVFNEIKDTDGVSVANPRMLVMYEAQYQNGDTVMKGFDLVTGEIIPIDRIPRELPTDIPNPETTGEVRALPTNPQSEEDLASVSDLDTDEPAGDRVQQNQDDLDLTASSTATTTDDVLDTDYDLDLRPMDDSFASSTQDSLIEQAAIPDVVISDFLPTTTTDQASSTQEN